MPDFDPQKVLIDWKESHGFTIADATEGVFVFGATGSGKTSGPGAMLARAYLKTASAGWCSAPHPIRVCAANRSNAPSGGGRYFTVDQRVAN